MTPNTPALRVTDDILASGLLSQDEIKTLALGLCREILGRVVRYRGLSIQVNQTCMDIQEIIERFSAQK